MQKYLNLPPNQILNPTIPTNSSFSLFNWRNTTSSLKERPYMGRSTPLSSSPNSLFLDARQFKIPDKVLVDEFKDELIGVAFNPAIGFLELVFSSPESVEKHLSTPIEYNSKQIHLSPPRNYIRKKLTLHLHGMPILKRETIHAAISEALMEYGNIIEIAPVLISNTNLLTPKWDVVIEPNHKKPIPTTLNILESTVVLTWVNSPKVCLHCKKDGHLHTKCPERNFPKHPATNIASPHPTNTLSSHTENSNAHIKTHKSANSQFSPPKPPNSNLSFDNNPIQSTNQHSATETNTSSNSSPSSYNTVMNSYSADNHTVNNTDVIMRDTTMSYPLSLSNDIHSSIHAPSATNNENHHKEVESEYTPTVSSENMSIDPVDPSILSGPNYDPSDPTPFLTKKYNLRSTTTTTN